MLRLDEDCLKLNIRMLFDELKITNDNLLEKVTALISLRMSTFVGFDIVNIANLKMNVSVKLHKRN